jgi:hypothetical protein
MAKRRVEHPQLNGNRTPEIPCPENGSHNRGAGHEVEEQTHRFEQTKGENDALGYAKVNRGLYGGGELKQLENGVHRQEQDSESGESTTYPATALGDRKVT